MERLLKYVFWLRYWANLILDFICFALSKTAEVDILGMIIGHQKQIGYLNKILENKEAIPHAFLFIGPDKVGKKTIALEFIKSIQCEKSAKIGEFCGKCLGCEQIGRVSADFLAVEPERDESGNFKETGIKEIRNLRIFLSERPTANKFKIAVIDDAHMMTHEAQNALLKSLEEPRGDKILFLITFSPENLLETILSRVYTMKFNLVSEREILGIPGAEKLQNILRITDFRPGVVFDCLNNKNILAEYNKTIEDFFAFAVSDLNERFKYIEKKAKSDDFNVKAMLDNWTAILKLALFQKTQSCGLMEDKNTAKNLADFIEKRSVKNIADSLRLAQEISFLAGATNVNKRLAVEMLALSL